MSNDFDQSFELISLNLVYVFCGPPAMLEGPLRFSLSHCLYVCMDGCMDDVGFLSTFHQKR